MATAGITDSAPPPPRQPPGTARAAEGSRSPRARRSPGAAGGHSSAEDLTEPRGHRLPPPGLAFPPPNRDCSPKKSPVASPSPNSASALSPVPNLFRLASRRRKGCGPATPALGEGATTPIPHPRPGGESSGKVASCPRTCLGGPFSAVAAQMSEPLPLGPGVAPDQSRPRPPGSYC